MKALAKAVAISALVALGTLASSPAMADHFGHGHSHHGGVRFGISLGFPVYGPRYYPAPYYAYPAPYYVYPPVVVQSSPPPVYVERSTAQAAPAQAQGDWYYCPESKAYYPYVAQCASGWQRVPAQPATR